MAEEKNACQSCAQSGQCSGSEATASAQEVERQENLRVLRQRMAQIPHKWLVFSGKGGVGKSTVAANLAASLAERGRKVGLLDIDFHGPSIPMLFGLTKSRAGMHRGRLSPVMFGENLRIMSISFLVEDPDAAMIWRGPMKMGVIEQLLREVDWDDTEILIVDSPPGTGDEPLSVCQLLPDLSGGILVTTPQQMAVSDVRRSVRFCERLSLPVLGVIENMSGFACPHCGETSALFKHGGGETLAGEFDVPFLGRIPLDPAVMEASDGGVPFIAETSTAASEAFGKTVDRLTGAMDEKPSEDINEKETADSTDSGLFAIPIAEGKLALHFGHCQTFALVKPHTDGEVVTTFEEPPPHEPGVLPAWLRDHGASVIIAGGMGTRAQDLFTQHGIEVVTGAPQASPEELVRAYLNGTLETGDNACEH